MGNPMANDLKPGERIRLKPRKQANNSLADERGIVLAGYRASKCGWFSYYVRMDGQPIGAWTLLLAQEIERDSEHDAVSPSRIGGIVEAAMSSNG
jgi:hypothetical protein